MDTNLYSRQIFTYGKETMEKIINLRILIIGLRGLGIEIAKNLILLGPKEVSISDPNICKINDLGANFFIKLNDVNIKTREESCLEKLSSLNKYVDVSIFKGNLKENLNKFNIIIITEIMKTEDLVEINELCRINKVGFIYTLSLGLTGYLFNDFGDNFIINDINGENNLKYYIFSIEEKADRYEIYLGLQKNETFDLREGDYIIFKEIKGLEFLNDNIPKKILKVSKNSFEIEKKENNINNNKYLDGGIVEEIKIPKRLNFDSLKNNLYVPNDNFVSIDKSKKNSNILLHCAFIGIHHYYNLYQKLPELNDLKQVNLIMEFAYKFYLEIKEKHAKYLYIKKKKKIIEFDRNFIEKAIRFTKSEINPICNFLGGIVSQEAMKITGKYYPIYQWLRFDFFEIIENIPNDCNRNLLSSRYDDQIAIFGQEFQEKLKNLNIFMIGAGALGCEYLKNFALMGLSQDKSNITVTDNDNIILSNLNRQFLFKSNDIGKNKSFCACREAKKINEEINLISQNYLVCKETRDIYDDIFWEKQNIIISAVDNIKARKYIDNLCTFYNKIFIDSGTEGTRANCDIYYPDKTICLNDLTFPEKEKIPMCTLKNFPTEIEHCIEYAKIIFTELFDLYIRDIKMVVENEKKFYDILNMVTESNELYLKLEVIKYFYNILEKPSQYSIIEFEIFIFKYYFEYTINEQLIEQNKAFSDYYNKKPSPININPDDETHLIFFKSFYYILANTINFKEKINENGIKILIRQININIFKNKINCALNNFKKEIMNKINLNINNIKDKINKLKPIIFEKDNDENNQINFIMAFSNLRANNYGIKNCSFLKAKEVAGNIIPAIASTTAAITGLSCIQLYASIETDDIKLLRCGAFNLGTSEFDIFFPEEKRYIKNKPKAKDSPEYIVIPKEYTCWDKIDIMGPNMIIKTLIDDFKNKYNVDIDFINYNNELLISPLDDEESKMKETIEKLVEYKTKKKINSNQKYIKLDLSISQGICEVLTPAIRYVLKNN